MEEPRYKDDDDNAIYYERLDDLYNEGENMFGAVRLLLAYFDSLNRDEATAIVRKWQTFPAPTAERNSR